MCLTVEVKGKNFIWKYPADSALKIFSILYLSLFNYDSIFIMCPLLRDYSTFLFGDGISISVHLTNVHIVDIFDCFPVLHSLCVLVCFVCVLFVCSVCCFLWNAEVPLELVFVVLDNFQGENILCWGVGRLFSVFWIINETPVLRYCEFVVLAFLKW